MVRWLTAKGIDTNIIKVNGDKITIDKNGVTIKMLDFLLKMNGERKQPLCQNEI